MRYRVGFLVSYCSRTPCASLLSVFSTYSYRLTGALHIFYMLDDSV